MNLSARSRISSSTLLFIAVFAIACGSGGDEEASNAPHGTGGGSAGSATAAGSAGGAGAAGQSSGAGAPGAGQGGKSGSAGSGSPCVSVTGSYNMIRTRDKANPGSCPPDYPFAPAVPAHLLSDKNSPSGYKFEIGYTDAVTGQQVFYPCVNNISSCLVQATCSNATSSTPAAFSDQVQLNVVGNTITGWILRKVADTGCEVHFLVTGTKE